MKTPGHPDGAAVTCAAPLRDITSLFAAALALPGLASTLASTVAASLPALLATAAHAELPPDHGSIDVKYLYYHDYQPGGSRMRVSAPSFHLLLPFEEKYSLESSFVVDAISGASPLFHDTLSGASGLGANDLRKAADLKLTRYFDRGSLGAQFAYSTEHDYVSRTFSLDGQLSTADNNTTLALGVGQSNDDIDSVNFVARGKHRRTTDLLAGVTQVLGISDIVQSNVTYSIGHGYYDDPYKAVDVRPDHRDQFAWLTRWNHYLTPFDATFRLSARYYRDTFGIRALALQTEWVQPIASWTITPSLRYYTQSAADFYHGPPFPQGFKLNQPYSADQRLSAFGAITAGVKIARSFADGWHVDVKAEYYEQRSDWRRLFAGDGTKPLRPFKAQFYQVGLGKDF
ncbi:MAG: DUF3570 domain-containing protein [Casimicrobiaceae bacterium]